MRPHRSLTTRVAVVSWVLALAQLAGAVVLFRHFVGSPGERRALTAVAGILSERYQAGDLIALVPTALAEHASAFHGLPVVAARDGSQALSLLRPPFGRLWRVTPVAFASEKASGERERFTKAGFEAVLLAPAQPEPPPPAAVTWLAGVRSRGESAIARARVAVGDAKGSRLCTRAAPPKVWRCGELDWHHVSPENLIVRGQTTRCIWAHPIPGATLEIELPPSASGTLVVHTALADSATRRTEGPNIDVQVLAGAAALASIEHPFNLPTKQTRVTLPDAGSAVRLRISSPRDSPNHFCFDLEG